MTQHVPISQWSERWWHVLASHRPSQLGWRAIRMVERRCFPMLPKSVYCSTGELPSTRENRGFDTVLTRQLAVRRGRGDFTQRVERLRAGEFCFLNQSRWLGPSADAPLESVEVVSHLWRFHLHYQEYVLDLLAAGRDGTQLEAAERIWPILQSWIAANPIDRRGATTDAWHPYCISRRIPVWLLLWHAKVIPEKVRDTFLRSLESQTRYLERHLEWDLRGNHLLENLKALLLSGACWEGKAADRRLDIAARILEGQFAEQLLPSGEHFERSPMYHAQMLSAVLDVRDATAGVRPDLSDRCNHEARRMSDFLSRLLHPDGQIPLLSDSTLEETPCPKLLFDAVAEFSHGNAPVDVAGAAHSVGERTDAGRISRGDALGDDGYWIWRDGGDFLLFDNGPVGADELPAHAHCDLLTIEASMAGERLIVDSGVFDYETSAMRQYCRSTAAHNVVQIDGKEQCDLWSRFRMGRRGHVSGFTSGTSGEFSWSRAHHNAFARFGVPIVGRWIACRHGGPWIVADWFDGDGSHQLANRLHFAPDVDVVQDGERAVTLSTMGRTVRLTYLSPGTVGIESGWYCPDFGVRREAPVVMFEHQAAAPGMIVWVLSWDEDSGSVSVELDELNRTHVVWERNGERLRWPPDSPVGCNSGIEN